MDEIVINNTECILKSDNEELKTALEKKYSCKVPGYEYTPQYRANRWRGDKKHFSKKTGKFKTGLLSEIIRDLEYLDYPYDLVDLRDIPEYQDYTIPGIEARDYQKIAIEKALSKKRCIIQAPTGSGKTIVIASIVKALESYVGLIFFTKKQLMLQTWEFLKEHGIECGIAFGEGVDIKPITLCTIQSIDKVLDTHLTTANFIIFDEVHEFSKGKIATKAISSFPNAAYRFGFTATVPNDKFSKLNLITGLGEVVNDATAKDLIELDYLSNAEVIIRENEEIEGLDHAPYMEVYDSYIINNESRNSRIAEECAEIKNGKILILVKNLKHLEILKEMIPGSLTLEGKDNLKSRKSTIKTFIDEEGSVLIGTNVMQTGIDIPEITHLINARGLKSEIATLQALGRALRKHKSKDKATIIDYYDNAPYLTKHSKDRIKAYKSLKLDVDIDDGKSN